MKKQTIHSSATYRSAGDVINAAVELFTEREAGRSVLRGINTGDDRSVDARLEMLLQEAGQSAEPAGIASRDWDDVEREAVETARRFRDAARDAFNQLSERPAMGSPGGSGVVIDRVFHASRGDQRVLK